MLSHFEADSLGAHGCRADGCSMQQVDDPPGYVIREIENVGADPAIGGIR